MSKSLGNNVDPVSISEQYGTDALRMALVVGVGPGSDSRLSNEKLRAYKNFANKVWNIARFVLSQEHPLRQPADSGGEINNKLKKGFDTMAEDVTDDMENYRFYIAAETRYAYIVHRFADELIE